MVHGACCRRNRADRRRRRRRQAIRQRQVSGSSLPRWPTGSRAGSRRTPRPNQPFTAHSAPVSPPGLFFDRRGPCLVIFVGFDTMQWSSLCSPPAKSPVRGVNNVPPTIECEIREQRDALVDTRAVGSARVTNGQLSVVNPLRSFLDVPPAPWGALPVCS